MMQPNKVYGKEGEEKELAKPNTKMQIRPNNRAETGGAAFTEEEKAEMEKKKKEEGKDIFTEEEVAIAGEARPDDRPEPKYEIKYK